MLDASKHNFCPPVTRGMYYAKILRVALLCCGLRFLSPNILLPPTSRFLEALFFAVEHDRAYCCGQSLISNIIMIKRVGVMVEAMEGALSFR